MTIEEKEKANKLIRKYEGDNQFIISLKKQLKNNKYLQREVIGNRTIKILSDRQYDVALSILN